MLPRQKITNSVTEALYRDNVNVTALYINPTFMNRLFRIDFWCKIPVSLPKTDVANLISKFN